MELPDVAANVRAELARRRDKTKAGLRVALDDMPRVSLWRRLSGEVPFSANEIARVADYLEVPISVLFSTPEQASA